MLSPCLVRAACGCGVLLADSLSPAGASGTMLAHLATAAAHTVTLLHWLLRLRLWIRLQPALSQSMTWLQMLLLQRGAQMVTAGWLRALQLMAPLHPLLLHSRLRLRLTLLLTGLLTVQTQLLLLSSSTRTQLPAARDSLWSAVAAVAVATWM